MSKLKVRPLRDLIEDRVDRAVDGFARDHPNLAAAIDRIELVEVTVARVEEDPEYHRAMDQAARDEMVLKSAGKVVELIDRWVRRGMGV